MQKWWMCDASIELQIENSDIIKKKLFSMGIDLLPRIFKSEKSSFFSTQQTTSYHVLCTSQEWKKKIFMNCLFYVSMSYCFIPGLLWVLFDFAMYRIMYFVWYLHFLLKINSCTTHRHRDVSITSTKNIYTYRFIVFVMKFRRDQFHRIVCS